MAKNVSEGRPAVRRRRRRRGALHLRVVIMPLAEVLARLSFLRLGAGCCPAPDPQGQTRQEPG
jgi:hypothetical protein